MTPLYGNLPARQAFSAAIESGSLHHAWIFAGPEGVGKAQFAMLAARYLLAGAGQPDDFSIPPRDRTQQLIDAGSHPDFKLLQRLPRDEKKPEQGLARSIRVDQIRELDHFLGMKATYSDRRVVMIDTADDLERPGASNALLKNLEEPPAGTTFLLISHAPGRLLPTIRSRCRMLRFEPLDDTEMVTGARAGEGRARHRRARPRAGRTRAGRSEQCGARRTRPRLVAEGGTAAL
jgi:DNA polymerase-3 subunit delta'